MGRGLSKLQRTILEMAYERFREAMDEWEAGRVRGYPKGVYYAAYVGRALPSGHALGHFERRERLVKQRQEREPFRDPDETRDAVRAAVDAEIQAETERVFAAKRELEERVRVAVPELWEEPAEHHYHWSPPRWSEEGGGYERFQLTAFSNNSPEARRYLTWLREKGLEGYYYWWGGGVLYTAEILERAYGFEPKNKYDYWPWGQRNAIKFDPQTIGEERYNAARASVSRALKRLSDRMLIEHGQNGTATITLEGIAELTGQPVNEICVTHKINRSDGDRRLLIRGEGPRSPEEIEASSAAVESLQNGLNPPPRPLADRFLNAIELHLLGVGEVTEEEIREAFEEGLARAKELCEGKVEAVNDSGNQENVSRCAETKA